MLSCTWITSVLIFISQFPQHYLSMLFTYEQVLYFLRCFIETRYLEAKLVLWMTCRYLQSNSKFFTVWRIEQHDQSIGSIQFYISAYFNRLFHILQEDLRKAKELASDTNSIIEELQNTRSLLSNRDAEFTSLIAEADLVRKTLFSKVCWNFCNNFLKSDSRSLFNLNVLLPRW